MDNKNKCSECPVNIARIDKNTTDLAEFKQDQKEALKEIRRKAERLFVATDGNRDSIHNAERDLINKIDAINKRIDDQAKENTASFRTLQIQAEKLQTRLNQLSDSIHEVNKDSLLEDAKLWFEMKKSSAIVAIACSVAAAIIYDLVKKYF